MRIYYTYINKRKREEFSRLKLDCSHHFRYMDRESITIPLSSLWILTIFSFFCEKEDALSVELMKYRFPRPHNVLHVSLHPIKSSAWVCLSLIELDVESHVFNWKLITRRFIYPTQEERTVYFLLILLLFLNSSREKKKLYYDKLCPIDGGVGRCREMWDVCVLLNRTVRVLVTGTWKFAELSNILLSLFDLLDESSFYLPHSVNIETRVSQHWPTFINVN